MSKVEVSEAQEKAVEAKVVRKKIDHYLGLAEKNVRKAAEWATHLPED